MKSQLVSLLLASLLFAACVSQPARADEDEYEDTERAHLIVRKSVADELVVQGRNVTVQISIFNAGAGSAKSVSVKDTLPPGASLLSGSLDVEFPVLSSGSSVNHSYVMSFATGGSGLVLPVASVSYDAEEGTKQTGASTTTGIFVMTPVQQIQRYAMFAGSYVSLGIARSPADWRNIAIVVGVIGALVGGNAAVKSANTASVSRKRQRALKELEKSD